MATETGHRHHLFAAGHRARSHRTALVAYATKHGSTQEVAETIAEHLRELGYDVDVDRAADVDTLHGYHRVVLGGSIYTGRWHREALSFLERHADALAGLPLAVFALGPRTLEPDDVAESRAQLDRALAKVSAGPDAVAIFGGVVDPERLRFPFSRMAASDARDRGAIRAWAAEVSKLDARQALTAR